MTEGDVDAQIKRYWEANERWISDEILGKNANEELKFRDVGPENPGSIYIFLSHLVLGFAAEFLRALYEREPKYPPEAMVRALLIMNIKKMKFYTELWRELQVKPDYAQQIGFKTNDDGVLELPSPKTFWHFDHIRMGARWAEFFTLMRNECVKSGESLGLHFGQKVIEDATPIEALPGDSEAEYNQHYKKFGYKLDTITDLEHDVPLSMRVFGINGDESKYTIPHLSEMRAAGIRTTDIWFDGGYDDYSNLAWCGVNGVHTHHPIHENWVHNPAGEEENIRKLYQKYWKDADFKRNADLDYILRFLLSHEEVEAVGAYYRNKELERYNKDQVAYLDDYHRRNRQEGHHGYWKEHLEVESRMRVKGQAKVEQYLTRNLCSILAVALCRLQHGVKTDLTSVVYFT